MRCCRVVSHPLWIRCVGGLRRAGWVRLRGLQVVRVQWWWKGLSRSGVAFLGGLGSSGVCVVAGRIRFLEGGAGGHSLLVGWAVGLGARWVLGPSHVVVLSVHGGLRAGVVGWREVLVVVQL